MKSTILTTLAFFLATTLGWAQDYIDQNFIEVNGKATIKVVPDLIYLKIQLSEKLKNKSALQIKENAMLERFKSIGIDTQKDLVIKDLASNFRVQVFSKDDIVISKVYLLTVHDGKTANRVITELEELQISNVNVDHLDHTKMIEYKRECLSMAVKAAKTKAEIMAISTGQTAGRALHIQELEVQNPTYGMGNNVIYKAEISTRQDTYASDLDFDEIRIESLVTATFELK
jgi:uncharacterized protein